MSEHSVSEKPSSVEVSRNAKGDYSFKVKLYFNEEKYGSDVMAEVTKNYMDKLLTEFKIEGK